MGKGCRALGEVWGYLRHHELPSLQTVCAVGGLGSATLKLGFLPLQQTEISEIAFSKCMALCVWSQTPAPGTDVPTCWSKCLML